jgi:plasmid stability protein
MGRAVEHETRAIVQAAVSAVEEESGCRNGHGLDIRDSASKLRILVLVREQITRAMHRRTNSCPGRATALA